VCTHSRAPRTQAVRPVPADVDAAVRGVPAGAQAPLRGEQLQNSSVHRRSQVWALGRALRRKLGKGDALSHLSLNVAYSSDFLIGATLQAAVSHSALLRALSTTTDHANVMEARSLGFLSRDGVEVRCGSWLLFACHGSKVLARVSEMAEVVLPSGPCVRLWCTDRRSSGIVEGVDGMIRIWKQGAATSACELLVRLETVSMVALLCCDRGPHLEFRYWL
jgi:hypothetical protein